MSSIVKGLETQLGLGVEAGADQASSLAAYDEITSGPLAAWAATSRDIGGELAALASLVTAAAHAQRQFLATAAASRRPADQDLQTLLGPTSELIGRVQQLREAARRSELFHHLSAVSESVPALGWVAVAPAPAPFVKEMRDAGMFYTNRVLKEWKEKDGRHADWVRCWLETLARLQDFVKQYHTTGLVWNAQGGEASLNVSTPKVELSKTPAVAKATASPAKATKVFGKQTDKTPSKRRDGKKWLVEYFTGHREISIDDVQMQHTVYIYKCENSAVKISGKCNNVVLDSCKKTGVVFDSSVAGCEVVNCQGVQVQVLGATPLILVDKTDGCQMYLSETSTNTEIVTAKSSEMNVLVPQGDGDFKEMPVPEQFKSLIQGTSVVTRPSESV